MHSNTTIMVLAVIGRLNEDDRYAVRICEELTRSTAWEPHPGTVYAVLRRLREMGAVQSYWSQTRAMVGGRARRLYRLTSKGVSMLSEAELSIRWR